MNQDDRDRIYSVAELDFHHIISGYVDLQGSEDNYTEYTGDCPVCGGDFAISTEYKIYHCFGCDKTGDAVEFLCWVTGKREGDIIKHLIQEYCLNE